MGYLDSNFNTTRANGSYVPAEQAKVKEDASKEKETSSAGQSESVVSAEQAMNFLGVQGALNKVFINVSPHVKTGLSQLNDAELSKAIDSLVNKYNDADAIARISSSMAELETKFEESKNFALSEFPDLSEGSAEMLALAGVDAQA